MASLYPNPHARAGAAASLLALAVLAAGCAGGGSVRPDETHGIVVAAPSPQGVNLFPVTIATIDGQLQPQYRSAYWLEPGTYTFGLRSGLPGEAALPPPGELPTRKGTLTVEVAAGKRYLIAAQYADDPADEWEAVVYTVEDLEGGTEAP